MQATGRLPETDPVPGLSLKDAGRAAARDSRVKDQDKGRVRDRVLSPDRQGAARHPLSFRQGNPDRPDSQARPVQPDSRADRAVQIRPVDATVTATETAGLMRITGVRQGQVSLFRWISLFRRPRRMRLDRPLKKKYLAMSPARSLD